MPCCDLPTFFAQTHDLSIFSPASPPAESIANLSYLVFFICGLIFVVVEAVFIYCVIRFRRQAAATPVDGVIKEPPQVYGSHPIEIAWTAAPLLVVLMLVLVTTRTLWEVKINPPAPQADDNTLFITVVGRQWWWEYSYEHYNGRKLGFITANELHIPASEDGKPRRVFLTLKSADVCHSFWVPRLGGKTDLIPGRTTDMWFEAKTPGLYVGQCAEYCGTQHAGMLLRVIVEPAADFEAWVANELKPAVDDPSVVEGKRLFLSQSCINCHRIRGTPAAGTYAPDLTHLMSRQTLAGGIVPNTPADLEKWIAQPQTMKPGCLMPGFGLSPTENAAIAKYLATLK